MQKVNTLIKIIIILTVLLLICTIDDFLSLHDIKKDYVSKTVLTYLEVETTMELPEWTDTELEWFSITISLAMRFIIIVILLFLLLKLKSRILASNTDDSITESL